MLLLPSFWTLEARLSSEAGIPELWDTSGPIINGTCIDTICSSLRQRGSGEIESVVGHYIGPYYFVVRPDGTTRKKTYIDIFFVDIK